MLWGFSFSTLETVVKSALWGAGVLGILAAVSAFVSGYVGYELADAVQRISDEKVTEAQIGVAKANEAAGKANASAAAANERARQLELETQKARLEVEKLKSSVQWRRISKSQHDKIVSEISTIKIDKNITIEFQIGDTEAALFAEDIVKTLRDGNISIPDPNSVFSFVPKVGLIFLQPDDGPNFIPIARIFAEVGIKVEVQIGAPLLKIVVGSKLPAF